MQHGCEEEGEEEGCQEEGEKEGEEEVASTSRYEYVGRLARLSSKQGDGRPTLFPGQGILGLAALKRLSTIPPSLKSQTTTASVGQRTLFVPREARRRFASASEIR